MPSGTNPIAQATNITGSQSLWSGAYEVSAEKINTSADLVGKTVSKLDVNCRKTGSPSGSVTLGVFNSSGTTLHTFGTVNTAQINATNIWISAESTTGYTLSAGESFGVKYTGGDGSNYVTVNHVDVNPPYNGTYAHWVRNNGSNQDFTSIDLTFRLYEFVSPVTQQLKVEFYPTGNILVNQQLKVEFYPTGNNQSTSGGSGGGGSSSSAVWKWWVGMRYGTRKRYGTNHIRRMRL